MYIQANKEKINKWEILLQRNHKKHLVGLHWKGNKAYEVSLYSRGRSMCFTDWLGLLGVKDIEFVSLQKGPGKEELDLQKGLNFVKGQHSFDKSLDFRDTAAVSHVAICNK